VDFVSLLLIAVSLLPRPFLSEIPSSNVNIGHRGYK
jgi:hypothetical protein